MLRQVSWQLGEIPAARDDQEVTPSPSVPNDLALVKCAALWQLWQVKRQEDLVPL